MLISRTADESWVLQRFLDTQPEYCKSRWERSGASHDRPDFILPDEKIGIELGEWLHEEQTAAAREIGRFEKEINNTVIASGLTAFAKSFTHSADERYMTLLEVKSVPRRKEKDSAIHLLLDFLRAARKPETARELEFGVIHAAELPQPLKPFFGSVHLWRVRSDNFNLGININRATSFDPEDAVQALLDELHDKLVTKNDLYARTKADNQLKRLWLVVHYGRGLLWNTPYDGIGLKQGRPLDEHASREIVVERAHDFTSRSGTDAFDKVFLFFDVTPGSESFQVWPR